MDSGQDVSLSHADREEPGALALRRLESGAG